MLREGNTQYFYSKYYLALPAGERNNRKKSLPKSQAANLQQNSKRPVTLLPLPQPLTAQSDAGRRTLASSKVRCPVGHRPVRPGDALGKTCQRPTAENTAVLPTALAGASCFCCLTAMGSAETLMLALKALSAIFCSLNNYLF